MSSPLEKLVGDNVIGKDGSKKKVSDLGGEGKVVGIYFSAHWCPPCRGFTPKLAEFYNNVKGSANGDKFDIIFVSSDRTQSDFDEYYKEMPWLAVAFEDREMKDKLSAHFNVRGIPTLILLDGNGDTISIDGRGKVTGDPSGSGFPWK